MNAKMRKLKQDILELHREYNAIERDYIVNKCKIRENQWYKDSSSSYWSTYYYILPFTVEAVVAKAIFVDCNKIHKESFNTKIGVGDAKKLKPISEEEVIKELQEAVLKLI